MYRTYSWLILAGGIGILVATSNSVQAVTTALSLVADPGNAADGNGHGAVDHSYYIGTYDVTVSQYVEFLKCQGSHRREYAWTHQWRYAVHA